MSPDCPRTLWLTNDLPPRAGGIEQFVGSLLARGDPEATVVVGPADDQAGPHDAQLAYPVVRHSGPVLPTPGVRRLVRRVAVRHRPEVVVLGASWPLGELAGALRSELGTPVVGISHGLEAGLCDVGLGWLIRRATRGLAALTTVSDWSAARLADHVRARRCVRIPPGVDVERFHPGLDGAVMRARWGVPADATVLGCLSRLVPRKGQDALLAAWPYLAARHPGAWLVLIGSGPLEDRLRQRAGRLDRARVVGRVDWSDVPRSHAALDVFAMPCRTRWWGLDAEGLGIAYLEAQACGVPVVAGRSGGAPETLVDGGSGTVVDGHDGLQLRRVLDGLLADPALRARQGAAGRDHVEQRWTWERIARRFHHLLTAVAEQAQPGPRPVR